ncbi:hypothetical protein [Microvirga zambiensis]|uniref:hypothetical protein n=1 Tax=Microvirga zambiensis TaxID=1402137 RepID=UPI00191E8E6C|nr:hypothetical protein [Microvirga zambiensis]
MASRLALIAAAFIGILNSAEDHDIYSHLKNEEGASCCDSTDCRPAPYRYVSGDLQMFVDGKSIEVLDTVVQYRPLLGETGEPAAGNGA